MEAITALAIAAAGAIAIAYAGILGPRLRIPPPLLLVVLGIAVSLLPGVEPLRLQPELVLYGILPPLLFTASVSLPTMDLRREFGAVSGLSVVLVLVTSLVLGWVLSLVAHIGLASGIALAAVISPTDSVATSIARGTGVSRRATAILEGESLLNDATALVVLRAAITATASTVSVLQVAGEFAYSLAVAIVIGAVAGLVGLAARRRVRDPAIGTLLSFALPYVASLPAERLGASGLIAAVTAGIVVGRRTGRVASPQQRLSDQQNWRTAALALEGAVFLLMGVQIRGIVLAAGVGEAGTAVAIGALAVVVAIVVRTAYVVPLLAWLHLRVKRGSTMRDRLAHLQEPRIGDDPFAALRPAGKPARPLRRQLDVDRFRKRLRQAVADIDYLASRPLGPKEGAVVVWAGMRGAVTVAAAETLTQPQGALTKVTVEHAELLVLIAFAAAAISLLVQGGTLAALIRVLKPKPDDPAALADERTRLRELMRRAVDELPADDAEDRVHQRVRQLQAQRSALLDARDDGAFDAELLGQMLETVDSAQITTEMFGTPDVGGSIPRRADGVPVQDDPTTPPASVPRGQDQQ